LASVISLEEAARRTGLTKLEIGNRIARRDLTIERDPVTGERGIYPHTLKGINGYQPPEPPPPPRPPSPPPPEPEPWAPSAAELKALVALEQPGRDAAMAELVRRNPAAREYFRDNPLPPVFRRQEPPPSPQPKPPPPPPSWDMDWEPPPEPPPWRPEPIYRKPPDRPEATPQPERRAVPDGPPVSLGWLLIDVLKEVLLASRKAVLSALAGARRSYVRLGVIAAVLFAGWLWLHRPVSRPWQPAPVMAFQPAPPAGKPIKRHRASSAVHHVAPPVSPAHSLYPLPPLLPPGAGRPDLKKPH